MKMIIDYIVNVFVLTLLSIGGAALALFIAMMAPLISLFIIADD